eukprot:444899-Amorphochlora_amoeboformis.AAC.2
MGAMRRAVELALERILAAPLQRIWIEELGWGGVGIETLGWRDRNWGVWLEKQGLRNWVGRVGIEELGQEDGDLAIEIGVEELGWEHQGLRNRDGKIEIEQLGWEHQGRGIGGIGIGIGSGSGSGSDRDRDRDRD